MEIFLNILLLITAVVDAVALFQVKKRIKSWGDRLDDPLSDEDETFLVKRFKLIRVLSAVGAVLLTVRVIVYELLPPVPELKRILLKFDF